MGPFFSALLFVAVTVALASLVTGCGGGPVTSAPLSANADASSQQIAATLTACSWPALSNAQELNVAYPDANATYWIQPLQMRAGASITVSGAFPGGRYFSFTTYNTDGTLYSQSPNPDSEIDDAQTGAASGTNYFSSSQPAPLPPTGTYALRVVAGPPSATVAASAGTAVLAAPPPTGATPGLTGWLIYRVYAPYAGATGPSGSAAYDAFIAGGVALPAISAPWQGSTAPVPLATLPPCHMPDTEAPLAVLAAVPLAKSINMVAPPASEPLFQYAGGGGLFPNADNKYIYAATTWQAGRLIVITGAAPTFPNTNAQGIVQNPVTDLRYWSMCTNKDITPGAVVACADDQQTTLFPPAAGSMVPSATGATPPPGSDQFAFVISSRTDKPANLDPHFTWLPWFAPIDEPPSPGATVPGLLIMRNLLPAATFAQAIQNIPSSPASGAVAQAQAVMGAYYPQAIYCDAAVFDAAYSQYRSVAATVSACVARSVGM
jgi:hypothetical protein